MSEMPVRQLRVPKFFADELHCPRSVDLLPTKASDVTPVGWFAIRLRDAFADTDALLRGERFYVTQAISMASKAFVVQCPDRDPLLLLKDVSQSHVNTTSQHLKFLSLPSDSVDLPDEDDVVFFAIQAPCGGAPLPTGAIPLKYKNYSILPVPVSSLDAQSLPPMLPKLLYYPRSAITNSTDASHIMSITVQKAFDAAAIAIAVSEMGYAFVHISNNNSVKVRCVDDVSQADINNILRIDGVLNVVNEGTKKKEWKQDRTPAGEQRTELGKKNECMIRRLDGNPVSEAVANALRPLLGASKVRGVGVVAFAVFGSEDEARKLHERVVNHMYAISYCGDPLM